MKKTVLTLLVDVTPLTREIISRAFDPADFDVIWSGDALEAMELSTRRHVDLLLLDLNQPLRKAWKVFDCLTTLRHGTPVILLTERKSSYEQAVVEEEQTGAVLQKPFTVAALVHVANVLLAKSSGNGPTANQDPDHNVPMSDEARERLNEDCVAPFAAPTPYRQWRIDE